MRRLASITAFALFLTVPLCAQRGGHAGGFGGTRSFSGAHMGGGHFSGGMHAGFSGGAHRFNSSANAFRGNRFSNCFGAFCGHPGFVPSLYDHGFRNCFGAFCGHNFGSRWGRRWGGWGWGWGYGYYDPWLWSSWDYDDYRFNRDYERDLATAQEWNEQNLAEARMRDEEEAEREHDAHARRSYARQNAEPQQSEEQQATATPTVLIYRDRHQKEVSNYAIVGQTLWSFTPQHKEKIPLADLDIPATIKANDDRGIAFSVPAPHEGQ
jgi:hypothetical protein